MPGLAKAVAVPKIVGGDVVRDADGNLVEADDPIDEEVAFYLCTADGHFFGDPQIGNSAIRIRTLRTGFELEMRDRVRRALLPMIERGDITDVAVSPRPEVRNGTALNFYVVTYRKTDRVTR
jgi:hypothetical protein